MARYQDGWVRFHRQTTQLDVGHDLEMVGLWPTLIAWANWQDGVTTIWWNGAERTLRRGELLITVRDLADHFRVDKNKIARMLRRLCDSERIGTESGTSGTIVTLRKYELYQSDEESSGTERGKRVGHEWDSSKERKKERKKNTGPQLSLIGWATPSHPLWDPGTKSILEKLTPELCEGWIDLYRDPVWIKSELAKAWLWYLARPDRSPKSRWGAAINTWLKSGWERYRVTARPGSLGPLKPLTDEDLK